MKKIIVIFLVLFVIGFGFFITKTLKGMSSCIVEYGSFKSDTKIENIEQACSLGRDTITDLETCYEEVQNNYLIPYTFVESFLKTKGSGAKISAMKELHNDKCSSVPQTLFR